MTSNPTDASPVLAYLGVGSNLGDRAEHIKNAMTRVSELPDTHFVASSSLWETEPKYVLDQPKFLNAVFAIRTLRTPRRLLQELMRIESELGRVREQKNGPRVIDLDILLYGDMVVDREGLTIPHPGIPERAFVLVPLAEIASGLEHPQTGETVDALLEAVEGRDEVKVWAP